MSKEGNVEIRISLPTSFSFLYNTLEGIKWMLEEQGLTDTEVNFDEGSWEMVIKLKPKDSLTS